MAFIAWMGDLYNDIVTPVCNPALKEAFEFYKVIYASRGELEMLEESMMTNREATAAAMEKIKADAEADDWFMAGLDTATLIDIIATDASEKLADESLMNLVDTGIFFQSPESLEAGGPFLTGFFEVFGPYGYQEDIDTCMTTYAGEYESLMIETADMAGLDGWRYFLNVWVPEV